MYEYEYCYVWYAIAMAPSRPRAVQWLSVTKLFSCSCSWSPSGGGLKTLVFVVVSMTPLIDCEHFNIERAN